MLSDEYRYKILKVLKSNPVINQRELANEIGVSLGKINYCINALIDGGIVKTEDFKTDENKRGYRYVLTPKGFEEKAAVTARFLKRKLKEYKCLEEEIEELRREILKEKELSNHYSFRGDV